MKVRLQGGAAAIEFAIVLSIFVVLLYGLVTFGAAFYTQMAVSRAAEDAARAVPQLTSATKYSAIPSSVLASIKSEAIYSLANSLIAPADSNGAYATRLSWLQANVLPDGSALIVDNGTCSGSTTSDTTVRVKIVFPYSSTRILPSITFAGINSWMPSKLTGCATIAL